MPFTVVSEVVPGAGDALHRRLAAQFPLRADFAGHACHFVGERGELVDIELTVVPMRRNSPFTARPSIFSCIFWLRSPSATASMTRATSRVGRERSSDHRVDGVEARAPRAGDGLTSARSVRRPSRPITVATRTISSVVRSRVCDSSLNALFSWPTRASACGRRAGRPTRRARSNGAPRAAARGRPAARTGRSRRVDCVRLPARWSLCVATEWSFRLWDRGWGGV